MKHSSLIFLRSMAGAVFLALIVAGRAQETPPATPANEQKTEAKAQEPEAKNQKAEPSGQESELKTPPPESQTTAAPEPESQKPEPGAQSSAPQPVPAAPAASSQPSESTPLTESQKTEAANQGSEITSQEAETEKPAKPGKKTRRHSLRDVRSSERPPIGSHAVPAGTRLNEAVVSIWGNTTIDGKVDNDAVSVFGDLTVNGHVSGDSVAVFGNLTLGKDAVVDGDAVVVFGRLNRHPNAVIHGDVVQALSFNLRSFTSNSGNVSRWGEFSSWANQCLLWGRPLGLGTGLGWAWFLAAAHLVLYLLFALLFPRGIDKCAETLEQHPGKAILTALLALLLTPLLSILLAITGIGLIVIPFAAVGLFFTEKFGRAAMLAWFGRLFTRRMSASPFAHAAVSVLIGGILVSLLYCVPMLGFCLYFLIGSLGLGMVIYALILNGNQSKATATPSMPATAAAGGSGNLSSGTLIGTPATPHGSPSPLSVLGSLPIHSATPPPAPAAALLPHAGFWLRMGALAIDLLLCGLVISPFGIFHFNPASLLFAVAIYGALLWKLRGTTIGGIICRLKVVRIDDRPLDWATCIVRALGCFLSLAAAGLGFIWIAIDGDRQSWHDKIAGTVVVRSSRSTSLV